MRTIILLLISLPTFSQINLNAGLVGNFNPNRMGINIGASYEIPKTKDLAGFMVMTNNFRTYNIPYYGAKIGKQTRLLGGMNFVNDYSNGRVLSQSFMVGFNYDFKKPKDDLFNMYTGFVYTHQYFLFRAGFNIETHGNKVKKRVRRLAH